MGPTGSGPRLTIPAWSAILAALVGTALMFGASLALSRVAPLRLTIVLASAMLAVPSLLALLLHGVPVTGGLALGRLAPRTVLLAMAAGLGLWVASLGLIELQYAVWAPPAGYLEAFRRLHEALRPGSVPDALWSVIAIAAAPAVFEELTVRGVLLPSLRSWLGGWGAVAASALAFALMHADAYRFAFTFAVGLALGAVRLRTSALWPTILAHATLNTLTFAAAPFLDDPKEPLPDPRPWVGAGLLLLGTAASLAVYRLLKRPLTPPDGAPRLAA
jgi:membrane protease YdiL (CAAX protease family)